MLAGIRFLWSATKGHRLRPWQSPYLRWRLETYSGKWAGEVTARDFWELVWGDRQQALRFLTWLGEMREASKGSESASEQGGLPGGTTADPSTPR